MLMAASDGGGAARTRMVRVQLSGQEFGRFEGAVVETAVDRDGSLAKDNEVAERTRDSLKRLIAAGRIRYNEPDYEMKPKDYFDAQGRAYMGVVKWVGDQMVIERVKIAQ